MKRKKTIITILIVLLITTVVIVRMKTDSERQQMNTDLLNAERSRLEAEKAVLAGNVDDAIRILEEAKASIGQYDTTDQYAALTAELGAMQEIKSEMQDPDFAALTQELGKTVTEWQFFYDTATPEVINKHFHDYADQFIKYIALYEHIYGTAECTCGELFVDSIPTLNDRKYFDLGTAYDYAIFFNLALAEEDRARILRSSQAEKSGVPSFTDGFTLRCKTNYVEIQRIESTDRKMVPVDRTIQYYDSNHNVYDVKHNHTWVEGTLKYDGFGRMISLEDTTLNMYKEFDYVNEVDQRLVEFLFGGNSYRVIRDISIEENVSMDKLLLSFAICDTREEHGAIHLLYLFEDGSIYMANEYYDDYASEGMFSTRYYLLNNDEMWSHFKDWIYLGGLSEQSMAEIRGKVADFDESDGYAEYRYRIPIQYTKQIQVLTDTVSGVDPLKKERLDQELSCTDIISCSVYQGTEVHILWETTAWDSSIMGGTVRLAREEEALDLVYTMVRSSYYQQWRRIMELAKTEGRSKETHAARTAGYEPEISVMPGFTIIVQ